MRRRWWVVLAALLGVLVPSTTTVSAASFTYDTPAFARIAAQTNGAADVESAQLRGRQDASASSPAVVRRAATTPDGSLNATEAARPGTALQPYYPANNGFHGTPKPTTLQPGATLDRYGSDFGRFTSPTGTPMHQRALPPGAEDGAYSVFRVVEPLTVQAGPVAPAFGSFGGGTQYLLPKSVKELLESGVIERVTP